MNMMLHFLELHLAFFLEDQGAASEEQEESFQQDTSEIERRCQGLWDVLMMADFTVSTEKEWARGNSHTHTKRGLFHLC